MKDLTLIFIILLCLIWNVCGFFFIANNLQKEPDNIKQWIIWFIICPVLTFVALIISSIGKIFDSIAKLKKWVVDFYYDSP